MNKFIKIILLLSLITILITACGKQITSNNSSVDNSKQPAATTTLDTNQATVSPENTPSEASGTNDTTVLATFTVTKMYCSSCSFVVKNGMEQVAGVNSVIVDLDANDNTKGIVKVTFGKTKTDINKIKQSVLDLGYGVE